MPNPKYRVGDHVLFVFDDEEINGTIVEVNFFTDPICYDVRDDNTKAHYKNVPETVFINLIS